MSLDIHTVEVQGAQKPDRVAAAFWPDNANAAGGGAGATVNTAFTLPDHVPDSYTVDVTPSQACFVSVTKGTRTFTVILTPPDATTTLGAGTFDVALFA